MSLFFFGNNFYKNNERFKIFSPETLEVYRILLVETTLEAIIFYYTNSVINTMFVPWMALLYDSASATQTLKLSATLLSISCGIHLISLLMKSSLVCGLFSQTEAPPHFSNRTLEYLRHNFPWDRLISCQTDNPWPSYSQDRNPPDYFLGGGEYLKDKVCEKNPQTRKDIIRREIRWIPQELLNGVVGNFNVWVATVLPYSSAVPGTNIVLITEKV